MQRQDTLLLVISTMEQPQQILTETIHIRVGKLGLCRLTPVPKNDNASRVQSEILLLQVLCHTTVEPRDRIHSCTSICI